MVGHLITMDSKRKSRQVCEIRDQGHGEEGGTGKSKDEMGAAYGGADEEIKEVLAGSG
jgi:hypothetical protein